MLESIYLWMLGIEPIPYIDYEYKNYKILNILYK